MDKSRKDIVWSLYYLSDAWLFDGNLTEQDYAKLLMDIADAVGCDVENDGPIELINCLQDLIKRPTCRMTESDLVIAPGYIGIQAYKCSNCGKECEETTLGKPYPFCPHCGAEVLAKEKC